MPRKNEDLLGRRCGNLTFDQAVGLVFIREDLQIQEVLTDVGFIEGRNNCNLRVCSDTV